MLTRFVAFTLLPLGAMVASAGYTLRSSYRLRDWRPAVFVILLTLMSIHQVNELLVFLEGGGAAGGFGELPETGANLTASVAVVLLLRVVYRQRALADRLSTRVERERELRAENERLDEFASVVSHDLRNPLNVAQGRVELLVESADGDDADDAAAAADALDRMEAILEGTLSLARRGEVVTDSTVVSLEAVTHDAWSTVETGAATLTVEGDVPFCADRERLREVVENLLRNAIRHAGPEVTVEVGPLEDAPGFYVADDGPGIPEGERGSVFEAGHTTAADGSGFGLAIVRRIAEAHGWSVGLTEGADGGARFEFRGVEPADDR